MKFHYIKQAAVALSLMISGWGAHAAPTVSADALVAEGYGIAALVDAGRYGKVWEALAPFVKASFPEQTFVTEVAAKRTAVGQAPIRERHWGKIERMQLTQGSDKLPAGQYVSLSYSSVNASGLAAVELVTFHLAVDGRWELVGYSIQNVSAQPPAQISGRSAPAATEKTP